ARLRLDDDYVERLRAAVPAHLRERHHGKRPRRHYLCLVMLRIRRRRRPDGAGRKYRFQLGVAVRNGWDSPNNYGKQSELLGKRVLWGRCRKGGGSSSINDQSCRFAGNRVAQYL